VTNASTRPIVARPTARAGHALWRLFLGGTLCAVAAAATGFALERARFGSSDAAAFARLERSVRTQLGDITVSLHEIAASLSREGPLLALAAADPTAARTLLDRADEILRADPDTALSVTVYGSGGRPLAWSGHPSDLPPDRLAGPEALFVTPGPLGFRLVYLSPVVDGSRGRRLGMIAAERVLSPAQNVRTPSADPVLLGDTVVPVSLRARSEGAGEVQTAYSFVITSPSGEPLVEAQVQPHALSAARQHWRYGVARLVLFIVAAALLIGIGPLLGWRAAARAQRHYLGAVVTIGALVLAARALLWFVVTPEGSAQAGFAAALPRLVRPTPGTPFDFLLTALLLGAFVILAAHAVEQCRRTMRRRRRAVGPGVTGWVRFGATQAAAGLAVAVLVVEYQRFLRATLAGTSVGILHFSIQSWNAEQLSLWFGLVLLHAVALWTCVLILLLASLPWRTARRDPPAALAFVLRALSFGAVIVRASTGDASIVPLGPTVLIGMSCVLLAAFAPLARARYRHASQALRLVSGALVLTIPVLVMYPSVLQFTDVARRQLIEARFAPDALKLRSRLQEALKAALGEIDQIPGLPELVAAGPRGSVPPGPAFLVWSRTGLATERVTSAVELYGADGALVSRFALNLPEYTATSSPWKEQGCQWDEFGEVSPFGSEERLLLHAGRGVCEADASTDNTAGASPRHTVGAVVVHVMLDYNALPFITSKSPYYDLVGAMAPGQQESVLGRDLEFAAYGWGRRPIYSSSDSTWPLDDVMITRIASSRRAFWTVLARNDQQYAAYVLNDRAGIYVLGYPVATPLEHLVNLAELTTLALVGYVLVVLVASAWARVGGRPYATGRGLLREVRASFYRKLLLAFVAASVVPVVTLALVTRAFSVAQLRASIESAAIRTAAVAQRVTEEVVSLGQRSAGGPPIPDDDIMLWLSRAINQDVNIFDGDHLLATSERDLFASGLLPIRTSSEVYRAIALDRLANFVGEETAGDFRYMLAATPVRVGDREAILTVPLALRQREIEQEIDELDRRVLLAALIFIFLGAGIGYSMAERIGDPVNRLTRATRRIARGDLTARIVRTSSDELRRLVDDFNRMAADLERQRVELERTHRLEAWADMARQVAHEIKNPLTPIQLSAEHLLRVHRDRGEPLTPALQECVDVILSQVALLRQISAEFSSFASSPTPHPGAASLAEVVTGVVEPYRVGLGTRVEIRVDVPADLPALWLDRTLLSRALTNIIENALHAMPAGGMLSIAASETNAQKVRLSIADTGAGIDPEALRRIFEPYFSTKGTGTGLGLTIAKRNVELSGGTIEVRSSQGSGTVVTITLPAQPGPPAAVPPSRL
jgi:signal transduction histidine kinase